MFRYKRTELCNSETTKAKFCESCSSTVLDKKKSNLIWKCGGEKNLSKAYEGIQVHVRTRELITDSPDFTDVNNYIMSLWIMITCSLVAT